ncbi:hypothetical protein M141_2673 [Bacteroides fragilis str. S38L5]|nr:hypothetical protein M141_2673 [Bacteroides fragilis str. S38L5]EYB13713.1 hypothetical protein M140_2623 [Bacteroides fragilis str. S38L3]
MVREYTLPTTKNGIMRVLKRFHISRQTFSFIAVTETNPDK